MAAAAKRTISTLPGVLWIALGLVLNPWTLGRLLSPDGRISRADFKIVIVLLEIALILWGLYVMRSWRQRPVLRKLHLALASFALFGTLGVEALLRIGIATGNEAFQRPGLYTNPFLDEDYWKLQARWAKKYTSANPRPSLVRIAYHERLGWAPQEIEGNPLGLITDTPYIFDPARPSVLFLGDSFVEGETAAPFKLPRLLEQELNGPPVYNAGISGYGIDQIYLRLMQLHPRFTGRKPVVVLGLYTGDIDRCTLKFRSRPKPRYVLRGEELKLENVPVPETADYLDANPVELKSYLWGLLREKYRHIHIPAGEPGQAEKEKLAASLVAACIGAARRHELPLVFVLFGNDGWRKDVLREAVAPSGRPSIDANEVLREHAKQQGGNFSDYFYPSRHPNEKGNQVLAEAIAELLRKHVQNHL